MCFIKYKCSNDEQSSPVSLYDDLRMHVLHFIVNWSTFILVIKIQIRFFLRLLPDAENCSAVRRLLAGLEMNNLKIILLLGQKNELEVNIYITSI